MSYYKVYCDNNVLHNPDIDGYILTSATVTLEYNESEQFEFTIAPSHPHYSDINLMISNIIVYQDDNIIFYGRAVEVTTDFYNNASYVCEGGIAFLEDTIQRPYTHTTASGETAIISFINYILDNHNEHSSYQIDVGSIEMNDDHFVIDQQIKYRQDLDYNTTLESLQTYALDVYDYAYLWTTHDDTGHYLNFNDEDNLTISDQVIKLGTNLLDFATNKDVSEIYSVVIPTGKNSDDEVLTIEDVNDGNDYVYSESLVNSYGWRETKVDFDQYGDGFEEYIKSAGENYLTSQQFDNLVLEITAVDLTLMGVDVDVIKLMDKIEVISTPHGIDDYFPVTKIELDLNSPSNNKITLGKDTTGTLTNQIRSLKND